MNPPNVSQARPTENCFAQKDYEGGWEAKRDQQLIRRIESKTKKLDTVLCGEPFREGQSKSSMLYLNTFFLFIQ